jgi:hypothetical protein
MLLKRPTVMIQQRKRPKDLGLVEKAVEAFKEMTGLTLEIRKADPHLRADVALRLRGRGVDQDFAVEVKTPLTNATLGLLLRRHDKLEGRTLLITDYVNPRMAERLRQMNILFLDIAGNAYLDVPPILVFAKGNRLEDRAQKEKKPRVFQPTGLKIVFALLCDPNLEGRPYRDLAETAGVALGTVNQVIQDLKRLGFLVEQGKLGRRLVDRARLLDRWVTAYPEQLRPKLLLGRFKAQDDDLWRITELGRFQAYWGGEVAAARITKYLKPDMTTVYLRGNLARLRVALKLKREPQGNVELLKAFWDVQYDDENDALVPPLLVYADLMASGDPRNLETAEQIYERKLAGLITED